jgi:hypothetical protein
MPMFTKSRQKSQGFGQVVQAENPGVSEGWSQVQTYNISQRDPDNQVQARMLFTYMFLCRTYVHGLDITLFLPSHVTFN